METIDIREKVQALINNASDDKLMEVYQLFEEEAYTDEFKAILDEEYEDYQKNRNVISKEEVFRKVDQLLNQR